MDAAPHLFAPPSAALSDEADQSTAPSPPDFRERLFASLEGVLTPIENRDHADRGTYAGMEQYRAG